MFYFSSLSFRNISCGESFSFRLPDLFGCSVLVFNTKEVSYPVIDFTDVY